MNGAAFLERRHSRMFNDAISTLVRNARACRIAADEQRAAGNQATAEWYEERRAEFARLVAEVAP